MGKLKFLINIMSIKTDLFKYYGIEATDKDVISILKCIKNGNASNRIAISLRQSVISVHYKNAVISLLYHKKHKKIVKILQFDFNQQ